MSKSYSDNFELMSDSLTITEINNRRLYRHFIKLPWQVHRNNDNWLPPLLGDEKKFFNAKTNQLFSHGPTIMLLAYDGKKPVGRVMGIISNTYNELHNEKTARFGFLECYNNLTIAQGLIGSVEKWAKNNGMNKIIGPYGFSDKDPQGLMIEGFEFMPIVDSPNNAPFMVELVEQSGYKKAFDCHGFINNIADSVPEHYKKVADRIYENNNLSIVEPLKRKELKPLILPVLELVNRTYADLFGFIPMDEEEMQELASRYLPVIDPRFLKVVFIGDKMVGFILGLPNFTPGFQKANGKLFPFGFYHILKSMRTTKQVDLMLGAVESEYRGRGIEVALALRLFDSCQKAGITTVEAHLVLESNTAMQSEMRRAGYKAHKKFRVYTKDL